MGCLQDEKRLYWQNQQSTAQPHKRAATPSTPTPEATPSDGRRRRTAKALQQAEGSPDEEVYVENEHELFCVCQQPYNIDTAMIECDLCNEWYHLKCMGLTQVHILLSPASVCLLKLYNISMQKFGAECCKSMSSVLGTEYLLLSRYVTGYCVALPKG